MRRSWSTLTIWYSKINLLSWERLTLVKIFYTLLTLGKVLIKQNVNKVKVIRIYSQINISKNNQRAFKQRLKIEYSWFN